MIPVTVTYTDKVSRDPNWGLDDFQFNDEMIKFNEHKSEREHSKKVYDWEILDLFFLHHNFDPNYNNPFHIQSEDYLVKKVNI